MRLHRRAHPFLGPAERLDWLAVKRLLPDKCACRGVKIESIEDIFEPRLLDRVRGEWKQTLGSFVRELPDVNLVLTETREALELALGSGGWGWTCDQGVLGATRHDITGA